MKRSKLKTADGFKFEDGKTYYYIYYKAGAPEIGRIVVRWSQHRWSKRKILRYRDLDGSTGSCRNIVDDGRYSLALHPGRLYREYSNAMHELMLMLSNIRKDIEKQAKQIGTQEKKYWQKAKQRGLLDGNTMWYELSKKKKKCS